jgi:CRP-like cAMP-binding protein
MAAALEQVDLQFGDVVHEAAAPFRHVYFPSNCLVSLLALAEGGEALEVGLIGRDALVGIPLALGNRTSPVRALVQVGGGALRMTAERFIRELKRDATLQRLCDRCAYVAMTTAMQIAACNRAHVLEARLARLLLMMRDRLAHEQFPFTQEFLARILGVRRAGVTEAASALQGRGLIRYSRGSIKILEPEALRSAACSCYEVIRKLENSG